LFAYAKADLNAYAQVLDINNVQLGSNYYGNGVTFTTPSNGVKIIVTNGYAPNSGTFDFIQPKLFQLDGKEGTLNGTPTRLNKASKRSLTSKR
jgi:hypothetical protein